MKYLKTYKLYEALGVPDFIDRWLDEFTIIIKESIDSYIYDLKDKKYREIVDINLVDTTTEGFHRQIVFDKELKNIIDKEESIKIDNFKMVLDIYVIPGSFIEPSIFDASFYREPSFKINYVKNPELGVCVYVPYECVKNPQRSEILLKRYKVLSSTRESISHELTHLYEFYKSKYDLTSEQILSEVLNKIEKDHFYEISDDWKWFVHLVYLSLQFEINARISEIDTKIKNDIKNKSYYEKEDFLTSIAKSSAWNDMMELKNFDADEFITNFELNVNEKEIKDIFKIENNNDEDIEDDIKTILLMYLIWNWNECIKEETEDWNQEIERIKKEIDLPENKNVKEIPEEFMNNPYKFFKYFEKIFHKKWYDFNRKVMRLSARHEID